MFLSSKRPPFVRDRFNAHLAPRPAWVRSASAVNVSGHPSAARPELSHRVSLPAADALAQTVAGHAQDAAYNADDPDVSIDVLDADVNVNSWRLRLGDLHTVVAGSTQALAAFQTAKQHRSDAALAATHEQARLEAQQLAATHARQAAAHQAELKRASIADRPNVVRAKALRSQGFWPKVGRVMTWPWRMLVACVKRAGRALGWLDALPT